MHQPQTILNTLTDQLGDLLHSSDGYQNRSSLLVKRLENEAHKLLSVDAIAGYLSLAYLASLCGEHEQMMLYCEKAKKLNANAFDYLSYIAIGNLNLGFYSVGQSFVRELLSPEAGGFSSAYHLGIISGAVAMTMKQYESLPFHGIEQPNDFPLKHLKEANKILQKFDISDQYVAMLLDLAGSVLRKRERFTSSEVVYGLENIVSVVTDGGFFEIVQFNIPVSLSIDEVADMNIDLFEMFAELDAPIPDAIHVAFRPVK